MTKWDYEVARLTRDGQIWVWEDKALPNLPLAQILALYGANGWELVSTITWTMSNYAMTEGIDYIFKRPLQ